MDEDQMKERYPESYDVRYQEEECRLSSTLKPLSFFGSTRERRQDES